MSKFRVELKKVVDDSYEIEVGYGLQSKLVQDIQNGLVGTVRSFSIITDEVVKELYAENIKNALCSAGYRATLFSFAAGEASKTRETKARIEDAMLEAGFRRDCCVIAVGGGVVTDLAGFVAGTFARGVPFINYATTLLSAADASVGGKTAVDTPLATNLIGLFYQPKKVYIDIATWKTLPQRQLSSGLSETIKHACLADREFFSYLEKHIDTVMEINRGQNDPADLLCNKQCEAEAEEEEYRTASEVKRTESNEKKNEDLSRAVWEHIAEKNCKIKYEIVMKDEKEQGLREVLNLGHTVGRAIEAVSEYRLLHGEALAIGLTAEVLLSKRLGFSTEEDVTAVTSLLKKAKLPTEIPSYIDREALVQKLYTDKKVRNGRLRFVIQQGIGAVVEFAPGVFSTELDEALIRKVLVEL